MDEGGLKEVGIETLDEISKNRMEIQAPNVDVGNELDKLKIHYRILDSASKSVFPSFEIFEFYYVFSRRCLRGV